jgi:hypothetical protein
MLASAMIDTEIIEHLKSFSTISSRSATSSALQTFLYGRSWGAVLRNRSERPRHLWSGSDRLVRGAVATKSARGAADGIKPGVERSETPGSNRQKQIEPAKRPIEFAIPLTSFAIDLRSFTHRSVPTVGRFADFIFFGRVPGVSLRSTPGFMPAGRFADFRYFTARQTRECLRWLRTF